MDDHVIDLAGKELGGYRLLHQLGAGGGGVVYLAQRLDQPAALFAIKALDPSAILDPRVRATLSARFLREAEAVKRLHHPHILSVLAAGEQDGYLYMALPFMRGGDLAARIGAFPRGMPLAEVNADLAQIAGALDEAHRQGIIHRDIKPTNILLDEQGQLSLADFGIARLLADDGSGGPTPATLTATGQTLGTPQYMAPEQVTGQRVGPAADIYALGVVLYQMVTGTPPFTGDTPFAIAMKHAQEAPPLLRPQRADLPPAAETAILRALAKRPEDRYATASDLAQAFSAGLQTLQPATPATLLAAAPTPTVMTPQGQSHPPAHVLGGGPSSSDSRTLPTYAPVRNPPKQTSTVGWAIVLAIIVLAVVIGTVGYVGFTNIHGQGAASSPVTQPTQTTQTAQQAPPTATVYNVAAAPSPTVSPDAPCRAVPGYSNDGSAEPLATSFVQQPNTGTPTVPLPAFAIGHVDHQFQDPNTSGGGTFYFELVDVCSANATPNSVRAFLANELPANGWSQSSTFPYSGDPNRACGDPYCWSWGAPGDSVSRYASLEQVNVTSGVTVYQLRLGVYSPT